jgi:hypothetical protein
MVSTGTVAPEREHPVRRVRDEVRDGAAVFAASAAASTGIAILVMLVMKLAG